MAVRALEKGMAGSFLQSGAAGALRRIVTAKRDMIEGDRQEVLAFLSGAQTEGYAPQAGEIVGILKQMGDEIEADMKDLTDAEDKAAQTYKESMEAKGKEVAALTKMIEEKLVRIGELGVEIATMKNDLGDSEESLAEDTKFLADLEKNCKTKTKEWEERKKTRADEILALAETIKILNSDDALELFKATLPSASASLVQVQVTTKAMRVRALAMVEEMQQRFKTGRQPLDFIALALHGKKIGFDKVIKMIDELIATLKAEQVDDDNKKEYCAVQFDSTDDKKKTLERSISDTDAAIADTEEGIATLRDEIKALENGIKALDKAVAEATEQRKEEHADFKEMMANDSAAKEVILFAKNRLNKFYNPKLYKPPAKRELDEEDRIVVNEGGTLAPTAAPGGISGTGITG